MDADAYDVVNAMDAMDKNAVNAHACADDAVNAVDASNM